MIKTKSKWIGLSWPPARELIRAQVSLHLARLWKQLIIYTCFIHGSVVSIRNLFFLVLFCFVLPGGNSCRVFHWIHAHVYRERWPGKRICWLRSCAPGRDENGRTGLSFASEKWQLRCILLTELNALKRNLMRYIFVVTCASPRAPESTPAI